MSNIVTITMAKDSKGVPKYPHPIPIAQYKKNLQEMPNGAALIMNNEADKKTLEFIKERYHKLIAEKILIITGDD